MEIRRKTHLAEPSEMLTLFEKNNAGRRGRRRPSGQGALRFVCVVEVVFVALKS
jgi:hypothetical protein